MLSYMRTIMCTRLHVLLILQYLMPVAQPGLVGVREALTITLHYITLHYITLHYITLHYITL